MKRSIITILIILLLTIPQSAPAEGPDRYSAIKGLIDEAELSNPELRALEEKIDAFKQRPSQARSLSDPMLKMSIANLPVDTFRFDQEAMTQKQISVQQKLPFPGKLGLKGGIAEREYYPDMDFGVSYGQRDDLGAVKRPDFISASVAINIPLWYRTKESSKVSEEMANERRAREQYSAMKNSMDSRMKELIAEIDFYREDIELLMTGLIPQSVLSYESSVSGYEVNKVPFLALINNQITLYNYKIEYYRAVVDHENSLAELEETAGVSLYPAGKYNASTLQQGNKSEE